MKNALNTEFLKFHNYLMEASRIDLKTFLGLVKPNQYSQSARKQISSWFWGDNFGPKSPNLHDPYIIVLPYYMINYKLYKNLKVSKTFPDVTWPDKITLLV